MIELCGVSQKLGEFFLKNIDLCVLENEYFVILGPTGTGKTVVLELISGMYKPDSGKILINGQDVTEKYPEERGLGFVYQDYMLFPHLTVRENILFGLKVKKHDSVEAAERLTVITELLHIETLLERYPATLSGGEQQRTAIARALITKPKVLLLDEPLSALDPRSKELFQEELKKIQRQTGTTTIHITHDFNEALVLADRIAIMFDGEIVQTGSPEDVFRRPQSGSVAEFVGMENLYSGEIVEGEGGQFIRVGTVDFHTICTHNGKVRMGIRPEDIILSRERFSGSAQNCLEGLIVEMIPRGPYCKVLLDVGILLTVLITKKAAEEMCIMRGSRVYAIFKSTAVHVF